MADIVISVVMPTYNSARTIEESLQSIRGQHYDQSKVEILVIDAGSTDETLEIAEKYNCRIIFNEKKLPEFAKQIGFEEAKGQWAIFIDSDEMFLNMDSFVRRVELLNKYPQVKNLVSTGMSCSRNETGVNRYANAVGDPFSRFVYQYNGYDRLESMRKVFPYKTVGKKEGVIYSFKHSEYYPLYDALGNMFNLEAARAMYEKKGRSGNFVANVFENMVAETKYAAMLVDDYVMHKPGMDSKTYRTKLLWRVKNNLFASEGVGFSGRTGEESDGSSYLKKRQYMYVLYSATILPVLYDAIKMAIKNKDTYFMRHFLWNEYVFVTIGLCVCAKVLHIPVKMDKGYGKK